MRLELCKGHLDWIEIRAIGWQEQHPRPLSPNGVFRCRAFVGRKIVENDDVALCQGWCELRFDIGIEDASVHRAVDDEGRGQPVASQPGDEGLGLPVPEWSLGPQALAFRAASPQTGHLGITYKIFRTFEKEAGGL